MEGETKEKQIKAPREPRERKPRDPNAVREPRPPREAREARPPREAREARGPRAPGAAGADGAAPKRKGPTFDGSKEEKQIDALVVKRTALIEKIKTITKKGPGSDLHQQVITLRNSLSEKKAQTTALNEKKDVIKAQVTGIRTQMQELITQFQGIKDNLPIKRKTNTNAELIAINIAAIDQNINKMETDEMNNATTISEEKDIMGRIAVAKGTKRLIESIQLLEDAIQQKRVQLDALNEEFDTINTPLKALQQEKEAIYQELQTKKALLDQERETAKASYDSIPVISGQIEAINRQIDELKAQRTARYGEWKLQQEQKREKDHQDYLARKKAREEADAARQARLDQSDEEKFVVTPYEKEIVDCDRTLAYLVTAGSSKAPATIRHTINSLGLFDLISISPPLTKAAVPNTITAVNEKKIYFIEAQKAEIKRREEAVAAKVAARAAAAAAAAAGSSSSSSAEPAAAAAPAAEAPAAAEAEAVPVAEAAVETPVADAPADAPQDA